MCSFFHKEKKIIKIKGASSFPQQYLSGGSKTLAGLRGTLVRSCLQPDDTLSGTQLFFGELSSVFFGWPRSQRRTSPFRMFVRLKFTSVNLIIIVVTAFQVWACKFINFFPPSIRKVDYSC